MEDLSRLLLGLGIDDGALLARERPQRALREVRCDAERHPGADERVAAEDRHVPRGAGGDDRLVGEVGVEDPQRPEVVLAAGEREAEGVVADPHAGNLVAPVVQPFRRGGDRHRLAGAAPRLDGDTVDLDLEAEAAEPLLARADLERHRDEPRSGIRALGD